MIGQGIVLRSDLERQKEQALALERAKHRYQSLSLLL